MGHALEAISTWVAVGQTALLLIGAFIAWRSLRASRAIARFDTVVRYFERYWSRDFTRSVSFALREFGLAPGYTEPQVVARRAKFAASTYTQRMGLYRVLNFFEELGTVYDGGLLDNKIILSMFGGHSIQLWTQLHWLIDDARAGSQGRFFDKWEILNTAATQRAEKLTAEGK